MARGTAPRIVVRAYNMYDLYRESSLWESPQIFPTQPPAWAGMDIVAVDTRTLTVPEENKVDLFMLIKFCVNSALGLCMLLALLHCLTRRPRRNPQDK